MRIGQKGVMEVRTLMFANRNDSLSEEFESFEAGGRSLPVADGVAPLLLMPF